MRRYAPYEYVYEYVRVRTHNRYQHINDFGLCENLFSLDTGTYVRAGIRARYEIKHRKGDNRFAFRLMIILIHW